jgi:hypothetical protein
MATVHAKDAPGTLFKPERGRVAIRRTLSGPVGRKRLPGLTRGFKIERTSPLSALE